MTLRSVTEGDISPSLSYRDNLGVQNHRQPVGLLGGVLQSLGIILRNAFFLPLYNKKIDPDFELNQTLAKKITQDFTRLQPHFHMWDVAVHLEGAVKRIFIVRIFESHQPIHGKKLQIVLFSFNGNQEGTAKRWEPLTMQELSGSALSVMQAFKAKGIQFDSMVTTSLGNVALEGLKYVAPDTIPPTLIINRGLTSVKKVANQLYSFPLNYLLYGAAKWSGWNADPEQELLNFLQKNSQTSASPQRNIMIIEVLKDFYFSEKGGFQHDLHHKIAQWRASVFRACFYPFPFHTRAHHAASTALLVNNAVTKVHANTMSITMENEETVASAIAKNIFFKGDKEFHTCFYICGNDATLDIGTAREAMPLLSAFVAEGQKMEQKAVEEEVI